jgi:hypothetical protein
MTRAYYSAVVEQPADRVWTVIRDFNDYPRYIDGVEQSVIEDDKAGDAVGAVRRFRYGSAWIRQRLVAHSDAERSFTYRGLDPFPFPEPEPCAPPAIEYQGTVRVTPVVEGEKSFVEWWVDFEAGAGDRQRWHAFLVGAIGQWVASLRKHVAA